MNKPWFKNYQSNVSTDLDTSQPQSLVSLFHDATTKFGDKTAIVNSNADYSYADIECLSRDFAAYLQNELNIKTGDRVALMCPNTLPFIVAMWGIIRVGAVQVNVNPLYTPRELQHQLNDAQVGTIVIIDEAMDTLAQVIDHTSIEHVIVTRICDFNGNSLGQSRHKKFATIPFIGALNLGEAGQLQEPKLTQQDLVFLQYTGGTTGLSKGAMLTHGNMIANYLQYREFVKNHISEGEEVVITAIPAYHIFSLMAHALAYFFIGAKNILIADPRDMDGFVETFAAAKPTFFGGVNTMFNGLLNTPGFEQIDFSALKLVIGGGAAVQPAVSDHWKTVTGTRISEGYGLSETSPMLTLNLASDVEVSGIGIPVPMTNVSIRDNKGRQVPAGERGELCAKGPQVMPGYWKNADATAQVMTRDGYFRTGDVGVLDEDGFFHIVDRIKDMILVSGFNVFPNEIEAEVANMKGILESACLGIDDVKSGEAVKLFAVKKDPSVTEQDVKDFCRQGLAPYKVPKYVEFIDALPKSSVGKILRRELRDR